MEHKYTIGQLAKAAGLPVSTIRYYERAGLLQPARRAHNNYRVYTRDVLSTLRFIRAAQSVGFTLDDVRVMLALHAGNMALCKAVQPLVATRLRDVSTRIEDLQRLQAFLQICLTQCRAQDQEETCHVVASLTACNA